MFSVLLYLRVSSKTNWQHYVKCLMHPTSYFVLVRMYVCTDSMTRSVSVSLTSLCGYEIHYNLFVFQVSRKFGWHMESVTLVRGEKSTGKSCDIISIFNDFREFGIISYCYWFRKFTSYFKDFRVILKKKMSFNIIYNATVVKKGAFLNG